MIVAIFVLKNFLKVEKEIVELKRAFEELRETRLMREKVEEGVFASRSHAVEYAVRQLMRRDGKPENIIS